MAQTGGLFKREILMLTLWLGIPFGERGWGLRRKIPACAGVTAFGAGVDGVCGDSGFPPRFHGDMAYAGVTAFGAGVDGVCGDSRFPLTRE